MILHQSYPSIGFSRGAYTARALAGMLYKIGLLPRGNNQQVPFAYKLYTKTDQASIKLSAGFKQTYCRSVEVEFLGVWWVRVYFNINFI
jgi:uncharacterized protein (DUF2235 family)